MDFLFIFFLFLVILMLLFLFYDLKVSKLLFFFIITSYLHRYLFFTW